MRARCLHITCVALTGRISGRRWNGSRGEAPLSGSTWRRVFLDPRHRRRARRRRRLLSDGCHRATLPFRRRSRESMVRCWLDRQRCQIAERSRELPGSAHRGDRSPRYMQRAEARAVCSLCASIHSFGSYFRRQNGEKEKHASLFLLPRSSRSWFTRLGTRHRLFDRLTDRPIDRLTDRNWLSNSPLTDWLGLTDWLSLITREWSGDARELDATHALTKTVPKIRRGARLLSDWLRQSRSNSRVNDVCWTFRLSENLHLGRPMARF